MTLEPKENELTILPPEELVRTPEDAKLPSTILDIDKSIFALQSDINALEDVRKQLLDRAIALNILSDGVTEIVVKTRNMPRKIDPQLFREKFSKEYALAVDIECAKLAGKIEDLNRKIIDKDVTVTIESAEMVLSKKVVPVICHPNIVKVEYQVMDARVAIMQKGL